MSHAHHESLPGYDPDQLLVDGCAECEDRAGRPLDAILNMDDTRQLAAWRLMRATKWTGGEGVDRPVSVCEMQIASALYLVGVLLERAGLPPEEVERVWVDHLHNLADRTADVMPAAAADVRAAVGPRLRSVSSPDLVVLTPGQRDALRAGLWASDLYVEHHGWIALLYGRDSDVDGWDRDLPEDCARRAGDAQTGAGELRAALERADR